MPQDNPLTLLEENEVATDTANTSVDQYCTTCPLQDTSIVFDPNGASIDAEVDEYDEAEDLVFTPISGSVLWGVDGVVDAYHRLYGDEQTAQLLAVFTPEGNGAGLGYRIERANHWFDRYDINHDNKIIYLDNNQAFSTYTNDEAADALHDALSDIARHIAFESETFWGAVGRIAMGTGLTVLGAGEAVVGVVGIIVPEPGTTAAGVALTAYGASTAGQGISMIFGANYGSGYNFLEEGFTAVGDLIGGDTGENYARIAFLVSNVVVSLGGTVQVLRVPNQSFIMRGHLHGAGANMRLADAIGDGFTVGRLQLMYKLPSGKVFVNITNNTNQWIIRLQQINSQVVINGRIIGMQKWHRLSSPSEAMKMLVKLAIHGF